MTPEQRKDLVDWSNASYTNDVFALAIKAALDDIDRQANTITSMTEYSRGLQVLIELRDKRIADLKAQIATRDEPTRATTLQDACDLFNRVEYRGRTDWAPASEGRAYSGEARIWQGDLWVFHPVNIANGIFRDNPPVAKPEERDIPAPIREVLDNLIGRIARVEGMLAHIGFLLNED